MDMTEKKIEGKEIFAGTMLHVYKDTVKCPNGAISTREYVKHCRAAAILPITDDGRVILERQFRYPFNEVLIEVPAGKCDAGETTRDAAIRELREETGYSEKTLEYLGDFYPTSAYSDEVIGLYLAEGLIPGHNHLDKDESLEVFSVTKEEFFQMCKDGRINDGKTLAIALRYQLHQQD